MVGKGYLASLEVIITRYPLIAQDGPPAILESLGPEGWGATSYVSLPSNPSRRLLWHYACWSCSAHQIRLAHPAIPLVLIFVLLRLHYHIHHAPLYLVLVLRLHPLPPRAAAASSHLSPPRFSEVLMHKRVLSRYSAAISRVGSSETEEGLRRRSDSTSVDL
jgi:hypothetical protein